MSALDVATQAVRDSYDCADYQIARDVVAALKAAGYISASCIHYTGGVSGLSVPREATNSPSPVSVDGPTPKETP